MNKNSLYVNVAIPIPSFETYIYKLDKKLLENLKHKEIVGRRVLVPFHYIKHVGIITEVLESVDINLIDFKIKEVEEIPDKYPVYTKEYIDILKDLSNYYVSPLGLTLYYCMPDVLRWKYIKEKNKWEKKNFNNYIVYPVDINVDSYKLSSKQKELLEYIISVGEISYEDLKELGYSDRTIKSLIDKGLLKKENLYFLEESKLSVSQEIKPFGTQFLKEGIYIYSSESIEKRLNTYINIIADNIYKGKSSLIIFPNVATLKEAYRKLKPIFGEKLYIYFDGLKGKDKLKTWFNLKNLSGLVCIGTFSSIFIPIRNLSLLVIEEEHSNSYKLMRTPRFDIRNVGYKIYKNFQNITFILASSVPSVETYFLKVKNLAKSFKKDTDILKNISSKVKIKKYNFKSIFEDIKNLVKSRDNILIITNKKGYSSFLYCYSCDKEIRCERCDIPLKVFKKPKRLECPLCKKKYPFVEYCLKCGDRLEEVGFGLEKIEETIKKVYPNRNITFTTNILDKELTIDTYNYIFNIYPDIYLINPSFKADERFFRNVIYPYIKSKREYIVFTNRENHLTFESLLKKNLKIFYKEELKKRRILEYPPFKQLILLIFEGKNLKITDIENLFNSWLKKFNIDNIEYEGVYFAFYPYLREKFRYHIVLKDFKEKNLLKELYKMSIKKSIRLIIDVSPKDIY